MSLILTLEHGPRSQAMRRSRLDQGELVIGRSADADWQIDDPDMFVSRAHCTVSARGDGYFITDTSSSGLFIDDAATPLGAGNSARLQHGMRLRLGDYVLGVEVEQGAAQQPSVIPDAFAVPASVQRMPAQSEPVSPTSPQLGHDDFFAMTTEEAPQAPRPRDLPDPFEKARPSSFSAFERSDADRHKSPAFDDPFSLEPVATPAKDTAASAQARSDFDDPFGFGSHAAQPSSGPGPTEPPADPFKDFDFGAKPAADDRPAGPAAISQPAAKTPEAPKRAPWELPPDPLQHVEQVPGPLADPSRPVNILPVADEMESAALEFVEQAPRPAPKARPVPVREVPSRAQAPSDDALYAAFLRGLGLEADVAVNPEAQMEKFGREYRLMMEGLMQLLRKRAEEKGNARVAQTVVGASEVNPLKFMPTVDDAISIVMRAQSPGFLSGGAAIADSVRDLASHHVRAWRGVQAALRRMIDRFDPAALEQELKSSSGIGTLLTGGKSAKLWELYQKRHREIAQSAETRFLGEIGADFRDAYEEE